jgi:hypothetical protein
MLNRLAGVVAAILLLAIIATAVHSPICPHEDSTYCVWVGPLQGNHRGNVVFNLGD